jgi:hypothetical protein
MDLKSVRKRLTAAKKAPRGKNGSPRVRIERTVGVVLVVLMAAAAMMLAARRPDPAVSPAMTSKVVAPQEDASVAKAPASHVAPKGSAPKNGSGNATVASAVTITVLDASHRWKLEKHVGERISVTGSLVDHEMQVKTLSRVTPSCG